MSIDRPDAPSLEPRRSLASAYPRRWIVPVLLVVALAALVAAYALPVMVVTTLWFFDDDITLLGSLAGMWDDGYVVLAVVIFAFSVVFPLLKLGTLAWVWFRPFTPTRRSRLLSRLTALGRWSMLDVFVVAVAIVLTQSKAIVGAEPQAGLYVFGGAVLLSMALTVWVERLAGRAAAAPAG